MNFKLFAGTANPVLAQDVAQYLDVPLRRALVGRFGGGEVRVELQESVRRDMVVIIQSVCGENPDAIMAELEFLMDAARRAWADEIVPVMTYYGYARQDRRVAGVRSPISARVIADRIQARGARGVMVVEPHFGQLEALFHIPCDYILPRSPMIAGLLAIPEIAEAQANGTLVVASPDTNGTPRARAYASKNGLGARLAIVDKTRLAPGVSNAGAVVGDVKGGVCVVVDDIIDGAGTMCHAGQALLDAGAGEVWGSGVHGVFSSGAVDTIMKSPLKGVVVSNTIPFSEEAKSCGKIHPVCLAAFIGKAIRRMLDGGSVSELSAP